MRIGVSEFNPIRLTEAREAVQLTQAALADLLDVTDATISKWEGGKQLPQEKALSALSSKLGYPIRWFTKPLKKRSEGTFFHRSNSRTTKPVQAKATSNLRIASEVSELLLKWLDYPEINLNQVKEKNFLLLEEHEIEQAAIDCRNLWGLSDLPIPDVILAMESNGIITVRGHLNDIRNDGVSNWINDRPYAFIASDKENGIRNRFDAAHELGHLICHRNVTKMEYQEHYKYIERQANLFASFFLMPASSFGEDVTLPTLDGFLTLKNRWKVSVAAMIERCHYMKRLTDHQRLSLIKGKSSRGWAKREPKDDLPPERPRLLHRCVKMLIDNHIISKQSLLDEMALPAKKADEICGFEEYFSIPDEIPENLITLKVKKSPTTNRSAKADVVHLNDRRRM